MKILAPGYWLIVLGFFGFGSTNAQVNIGTSVNISIQPPWGPVGYQRVDYYYLPDIEIYYSVPAHQFISWDGSKWVFTDVLPKRYQSYNLYRGYKVVINEQSPYLKHYIYRVRYMRFRCCYNRQRVLRDSRGRYSRPGSSGEHDRAPNHS